MQSLEEVRRGIERALWRKQMLTEMEAYFRKLWAENRIKISDKFKARYNTDTYR